jgi:Fic family protein
MENVRGETFTPGDFRRSQNWIEPAGCTPSSTPYVPPPVEEMHQALDALEKFIHANTQIPSLVRAGMIHYQFEAIHPFLDGNGRVGRLLVSLLLHEWRLLPQPLLNLSVFIERYRQEYYDHLLAVSQQGAWEAWLRFFLRGVSEQACDSLVRMERLQAIRIRYQSVVNMDRNPERMSTIIDFLFTRPIFSIRQASAGLGIPFKTMRDYIEKLVQGGLIREITGFARNRIYQADEILKAVQGIDLE